MTSIPGYYELKERLDRIIAWHTREQGPHGMVGSYCVECGTLWPCDTRQMAEGTHVEGGDKLDFDYQEEGNVSSTSEEG